MPSKSSVKPSAYPTTPFHIIRTVALLSSVVVGIILAVFIYHLRKDGYKFPYSFLVLLITALLSIFNAVLTTVIHCSCSLSTRLSITLNTILVLLWAISLGLLSWSMANTILTTCTPQYWGNATGMNVCRTYKALFSFTVSGLAAYIAHLWLDAVVRRRQNRLGTYGPMGSDEPGLLAGDLYADVKLADRRSESVSAPVHAYESVPPTGSGALHVPPHPPAYTQTLESDHAGEAQQYYEDAPARSQRGAPRVRFSAYDRQGYHAYQAPAEQTSYDPAMYR
ncbi:hypothetical protein NUU61_002999 [Penicillium alfredii]|uniref:MARVEL domain-containing protein n=1 Tax=Penicillium alfredii TaxID=1506179 RepID=A0A9W9FTL8_9EURO|nr:uncharacterized protein NUU61_002999 [Penicillium alfredii]KAJ5105652.1 hypothetical protein NUU61_002999 [Penicillium alfredii]